MMKKKKKKGSKDGFSNTIFDEGKFQHTSGKKLKIFPFKTGYEKIVSLIFAYFKVL